MVWLISLLLFGGAPIVEHGNATVFGTKGDKWAGGPAACATTFPDGRRRHMPISWHRRRGTVGIAHRTLPCGTKVRITVRSTGRTVVAEVIDRGPYGACTLPGWEPMDRVCPREFWKVQKKWSPKAKWRSVADLLPATGKALGLRTGVHPVKLEVVR